MNYTGFPWEDFPGILLGITGYIWSVWYFCSSLFPSAKKHTIFFTPLLFAAVTLTHVSTLTGHLSSSIACFLWQALFVLWVLAVFYGEPRHKFLAALIPLTATMLVSEFIVSLLTCLYLIFLHLVCQVPSPVVSFAANNIILLLALSCTILAVRLLSRHMALLFGNHIPKWYTLLLIPLLCITVLWNLIYICAGHGILFRSADIQNMYINQLFSYTGICILSSLCMLGTGFYLFGMAKIDLEQKKKEHYRSQTMFYQMLSEQYAAQERLRHDMKNHIIGLRQLIACREWEPLEDYLHKMAKTGGLEYPEAITGKHIVDALLYDKHKRALQNHIHWECDVLIPSYCPVTDFDLCVIFGNIIDNALEACNKADTAKPPCGETTKAPDKFVHIICRPIKKFLLIEVVNTNPANGASKSADPLTIKNSEAVTPQKSPSCKTFGIGLMNVQEAVNKYNGTLEIAQSDNTYRISILLPFID